MLTRHVLQLLTTIFCAFAPTLSAQDSPGKYLKRELPEQWTYTPVAEQILPADDAWWRDFGDSTLDSLISMGETNNYNLDIAARRVAQAAQAVRAARASWFPTVGATAGWQRAKEAGTNPAGGYSIGLQASWEIDVFGKTYSRVRQQGYALQASRAQYTAAMISLCAQIATTYFDLRTAQAQQRVAQQHIASQDTVVKIAEARHEAGLVSGLDVAQAKTVLYSTQSSLPLLDTQIRADINALATLCGVYAADIEPMLRERTGMQPDYLRIVDAGVPAELLRRRPDVVAAEAGVAQAAAALGVAKKDYLPTLSITGAIGTSAAKPKGLFKDGSMTWSVAPSLSWTIFDGLAREASVATAREAMQSEIDSYNATVQNAVQEVENAIITYSNDLRQIEILDKVVEQSHVALSKSLAQYKQGLSPLINVVNAQMNYLNYSNSLLSARGDALSSLATLYRALGGGTAR